MEEIKKCKKNGRLPWKTKDFLTITSFLPWKTTTKIKNITEIRQLDTVRDESYRALQFTVRAAKHRRAADVQAAADEVEKVMRRYPELAAQSNISAAHLNNFITVK